MNKKLVSWILSLIILATLAAPVLAQEESSTPFVFGSSNFSQKFSPFFYQSAFDGDIVDLVAPELLKNDRLGAVVFNGIDGEFRTMGKTIPITGSLISLSIMMKPPIKQPIPPNCARTSSFLMGNS